MAVVRLKGKGYALLGQGKGARAAIRGLGTSLGLTLLLTVGALGCQVEPEVESPENLVKEFIERMRRVHGDRHIARGAYELLWKEAQQNLEERAERASALAGRKIAPEEMIAPSRFILEFEPQGFSAYVRGDWATVRVSGDDPDTQQRSVPVVRESGHWRVAVRLPPLAPIRKRVSEEADSD